MILSLDTNVMIDIANGRRADVRARFDAAIEAGEGLVACSVVAHELMFGALISRRPQVQSAVVETLLNGLDVVDFTQEDGFAAARLRRDLRAGGRTIGAYDLLIAGQALNRGWTVVSANLHEFQRVEGLRTVDWTRA